MADCTENLLSLTKVSETVILKEKDEGWAPDKSNLKVLESRGYIVGETIGEGECSKVKKAFCTRSKETVAIKVIYKSKLHPRDRRKFIPREIEVLRTSQHPGLVIFNLFLAFFVTFSVIPDYRVIF